MGIPSYDDFDINDDEVIYQILYDRYLIEWQRATSIENKATCIIGFIGALLVFSISIGLSNFSDIVPDVYMLSFYDISIFLLILAFISTMMALFSGNKKMKVLDTERIMKEYVDKNKSAIKATNPILKKNIAINNEINITKNKLFKIAILLFFISCICLLIFTIWYSYSQNSKEISNSISNITNSFNSQPKNACTNNQKTYNITKLKNCSYIYIPIYYRYNNTTFQ